MLSAFTAYGANFNAMLERAKRGDVNAQYEVGRMYGEGDGVKQDYKKAHEWLLKAAERGHPIAQNNLGYMYEHGFGVKLDYRKAREWYMKAIEQHNGSAYTNLGWLYQNGFGVKRDYKKAFDYYSKGSEQGASRAMNQLGWLYENGLGVKADQKEAFKWYEKSADKGNGFGLHNLGRMYENGITVEKDINKAIELYEQSAAKGNDKGKKALARLNSSRKTIAGRKTSNDINSMLNELVSKNDTSDKPRLAVRAFIDRTGEGNEAADAIMDMMVSELDKERLFNLIERELFDEYIGKEINLGQSDLIDKSTAVPIGKLKGVQYTMTGSITVLYYSEKASGVVIPILGIATQAKTAYVVIDIRILNNETGEIVYASDQTGQAKRIAKGAAATDLRFFIGGYSRQIGGLLQEAARDAVRKHVSAIKKQVSRNWL